MAVSREDSTSAMSYRRLSTYKPRGLHQLPPANEGFPRPRYSDEKCRDVDDEFLGPGCVVYRSARPAGGGNMERAEPQLRNRRGNLCLLWAWGTLSMRGIVVRVLLEKCKLSTFPLRWIVRKRAEGALATVGSCFLDGA